MSVLAGLVRLIDALSEWTGRLVAWFGLLAVLLCFAVVVLRYAFGIGMVWMQELYVWFHALLFLLGAAFTLKHDGHVRVDAVYSRLSLRRQAWLDIFGTLVFLLPWLVVVGVLGWDFALAALRIDEPSGQPGGLPDLWLLKLSIPAFCVLVGLQGLALAGRRILELAGHPDFELRGPAADGEERIVG